MESTLGDQINNVLAENEELILETKYQSETTSDVSTVSSEAYKPAYEPEEELNDNQH